MLSCKAIIKIKPSRGTWFMGKMGYLVFYNKVLDIKIYQILDFL
jgi:hypothetical protein